MLIDNEASFSDRQLHVQQIRAGLGSTEVHLTTMPADHRVFPQLAIRSMTPEKNSLACVVCCSSLSLTLALTVG